MIRCIVFTGLLALVAFVPVAQAANDTPVGTWRTFDDNTGKATSIVKIHKVDGVLQGKVVKVLYSDQGPHPICKECEGERHNQPVEGMQIIWGLERDGDEWDNGHILDPGNGKVYDLKMSVTEGGQKLEVRGYIGWSLFGRTQVWQRIDPAELQPEAATPPAAAATAASVKPAAGSATASSAAPAAAASVAAPDAAEPENPTTRTTPETKQGNQQ